MIRKIILITFLLMLLLMPIGIVIAQSLSNFQLDRFTQMSGGAASYRPAASKDLTEQKILCFKWIHSNQPTK